MVENPDRSHHGSIIARQLDNEAFGQFVCVFSLLAMLSIVTDLGAGRLIVGGLVRDDDPAGTYILIRTLLGLIGYGASIVVMIAPTGRDHADLPVATARGTTAAGCAAALGWTNRTPATL